MSSRRALIIGCPYGGLTGVENDTRAMAELLTARGFASDACIGPAATRDGILDAFRRLVADTREHDAVVVYYSGHGGLAERDARGSEGTTGSYRPERYQFLVPSDFGETTEGDFRGIAAPELSRILRDLTARTANMTIILDCCHAGRMARDGGMQVKALPRTWYEGVEAHVERLRRDGLLAGPTFVEGNPDAVRLVASATTESAFEYTNPQGRRRGIFTESLQAVLAEANGHVSWRQVVEQVRARTMGIARNQTPTAEGPVNRRLFDTATVSASGMLVLGTAQKRPVLLGGRLAGVEVGDSYAVMPFGSEAIDTARQIAVAHVRKVRSAVAAVDLDFIGETRTLPEGAVAFPCSRALRRWPVRIEGEGAFVDDLRQKLAASAFVFEAEAGEAGPLATVVVEGGQVALLDRSRLPLLSPQSIAATARTTIANLEILSRAQHLLLLEDGANGARFDPPVQIAWGRVEQGRAIALDSRGETLLTGEAIFVTLRNTGKSIVYASIFDVGVSGKVSLLSASAPAGINLLSQPYTLGEDDFDGTLAGLPLGWPETMPAIAPRDETIVIMLSDQPIDLRSLETDAMQARAAVGGAGGGSGLARLVDQLRSGGRRDLSASGPTADVRYAVRRIAFRTDPAPRAIAALPEFATWARSDRGYVFDERPDRSAARAAARALVAAPSAVAVRLIDVVVHRNRALFGGASIRLDCMVVTGPKAGAAAYSCQTQSFSGIRDGEPLPIDRMLAFHGPVDGFLDIAIWVSRDEAGRPPLAELVASEVHSSDFATAVGALAGLAALGPQGAAVVVAIGAAATLTSIAGRLIAAASGKSVGLYRTSLLAGESFGVGRHPDSGVLRSQDFSFAYEVVPV